MPKTKHKPTKGNPVPQQPDITALLTDAQLATLRAGYDAQAMNNGARGSTEVPWPPSAPFTEFIISRFYSGTAWKADRREQVLIALCTSKIVGSGRTLAIHLYWGLMEGLSVADIADTLLLVGAYAGVDCFTTALGIFRTLLGKVLAPAATTGGDAAKTMAIVPQIAASFP